MLTVILAKRANLLCLDIYKFLFEEENSSQLWTEGFTTYQQNMSMTQKKKNCPFTNVLSTMSYSKIYLNVTQNTEYLS